MSSSDDTLSTREWLIVFAQSFAVFVGISILAGRFYFLIFFEELHIPVSSVPIATIDYAVFGPDVALMSILITLGLTFGLIVGQTAAKTKVKPEVFTKNTLFALGGSFLAVVISYSLIWFAPLVFFPGMYGLIFGASMGTLVGVPGGMWGYLRYSRIEPSGFANHPVTIIVAAGFVFIFVLFALVNSIRDFGEIDARQHIFRSPTASLEFIEAYPVYLLENSNSSNTLSVPLRIIYTDSNFVYVMKDDQAKLLENQFGKVDKSGRYKGRLGEIPELTAIPKVGIKSYQHLRKSP